VEHYYINIHHQENGDNEVHTSSCTFLPDVKNRKYPGLFLSCHEAIPEAKKQYPTANGCYHCSEACHTS